MSTDRNISFDIAKGIAIILIVLGHIRNGGTDTPLDGVISFINYFHVAVFFIISGYFVHPEREWKEYVTKKANRLASPYLVANAILLIVDLILTYFITGEFPALQVKDAVRAFAGVAPARLAIPTWFLMTLFYSSILYKFLFNLIKDNALVTSLSCIVLSLVCFLIQDYSSLPGMVFITRTSISLGFFSLGHLARKYEIIQKMNSTIVNVILFIGSMLLLVFLFFIVGYRVSFYWMKGYNLMLSYLAGVAGTVMIVSLSILVSRRHSVLCQFLNYVGRCSMYILLGHYPAFLLMGLFQVLLVERLDFAQLMESICPVVSHGWWIVFLISGIVLPLLLKMALSYRKGQSVC